MVEERDYSSIKDHSGDTYWPDIAKEDRILGRELKWLKANEPQKLVQVISQMTEEEAANIASNRSLWARDSQLVDFESMYTITLYLCGRG